MKRCFLVGTGDGAFRSLTLGAVRAVEGASLVAGSERAVADVEGDLVFGRVMRSSDAGEIARAFEEEAARNGGRAECCAVFAGDPGFHSLAPRLRSMLVPLGWEVEVVPGLSSAQCLAARLGVPWHGWNLVSAHAPGCDVGLEVASAPRVFFLTGGRTDARSIVSFLCANRVRCRVSVGRRLGYADESVRSFEIGGGGDFSVPDVEAGGLAVVLVEREFSARRRGGSLPDSAFLRSPSVPMTKRVVRAAAVSLLSPADGEVVWDVGTGTGALAIDVSRAARVSVHSVERDVAALSLARRNREAFCALNLHLHCGSAPSALASLPAPDAVFVGGSGGRLDGIVGTALERNPSARIVVACVTVETLSACREIARALSLSFGALQVSAASSAQVGGLSMMKAENPVWLVSLERAE